MPLLAENPNLAVIPDFETNKYAQAHAQQAIDEQHAIRILANLCHIQNEVDKHHWATRVQEETQAAEIEHRCIQEDEGQHCQMLIAEQEATITEQKMKSGEYCKLFYFTNSGLEEASRATFTVNEDALIMLPTSDELHK
jgi:hypothetical protein